MPLFSFSKIFRCRQNWTPASLQQTLNELTELTIKSVAASPMKIDLVVWPESPAPFSTNDPRFREAVSEMARDTKTWTVAGAIGIGSIGAGTTGTASPVGAAGQTSPLFNSAVWVSPGGEWMARYDKIHLVPFGEYLPFPSLFSFAGGLTKEVGESQPGTSRSPHDAGDQRLGVFICYESIFPDEVRQFANQGAQVFVNISNDGWYGDSGAYAQHLNQTRMRAIENNRWLLSATDTGVTAVHRSLGTGGSAPSPQAADNADRALRAYFRYHFLHSPRRLVRLCLCDNFYRSAAHALPILQEPQKG